MRFSARQARPNCLEASGLRLERHFQSLTCSRYAICCRNECEDLQGQLESRLQSSMAEPKDILAMVRCLEKVENAVAQSKIAVSVMISGPFPAFMMISSHCLQGL